MLYNCGEAFLIVTIWFFVKPCGEYVLAVAVVPETIISSSGKIELFTTPCAVAPEPPPPDISI